MFMNQDQARAIDAVLTKAAQGYRNAEMVGDALFPIVPVPLRKGDRMSFGKEEFQAYSTLRAPGAVINRMNTAHALVPYALKDRSLGYIVPREIAEEVQNGPMKYNLVMRHQTKVLRAMALEKEVEQATKALDPANYGAANKIALAGANVWTNVLSDPISQVEDAKEAVRAAIGLYPNTFLLSAVAFKNLKKHASIVDRIKYTSREVATPELLAELFGVEKVVIGKAVKASDAGVFSDVWGSAAVLAYTNISATPTDEEPSYGYTFQLENYPYATPVEWDRDRKSWVGDVTHARGVDITALNAGYVFQNTI